MSEHVRREVAGLLAAYGAGVLLAVQSRVNGELGHRLGDGVLAALISMGAGGVLLALAWLGLRQVRKGVRAVWRAVRTRGPGLRWWQCLGGLVGAYVVAVQSATVALIGVAVFSVALVAGQAASSLVVDRFGFGPAGPRAVTGRRVVGAVLAFVAVVVAVSARFGDPSWLALALLAAVGGAGTAVQAALNGRVAVTASSAIAAALVNFAVAVSALMVVYAVDLVVRGAPRPLPSEPWLYIGGALGVGFITLMSLVVRIVGVFLLGLGIVAGQLSGGVVLDGLVGQLTVTAVLGTVLALLAVLIASSRPGRG